MGTIEELQLDDYTHTDMWCIMQQIAYLNNIPQEVFHIVWSSYYEYRYQKKLTYIEAMSQAIVSLKNNISFTDKLFNSNNYKAIDLIIDIHATLLLGSNATSLLDDYKKRVNIN